MRSTVSMYVCVVTAVTHVCIRDVKLTYSPRSALRASAQHRAFAGDYAMAGGPRHRCVASRGATPGLDFG